MTVPVRGRGEGRRPVKDYCITDGGGPGQSDSQCQSVVIPASLVQDSTQVLMWTAHAGEVVCGMAAMPDGRGRTGFVVCCTSSVSEGVGKVLVTGVRQGE